MTNKQAPAARMLRPTALLVCAPFSLVSRALSRALSRERSTVVTLSVQAINAEQWNEVSRAPTWTVVEFPHIPLVPAPCHTRWNVTHWDKRAP